MRNEFIKVLVVFGFALTFFLSCTDNPTPDYPDIGYFISSSSRLSSSSKPSSSSSIFSSSSIASSSSSKPSSSSSMPSSSSKLSSSSAVPSSSSYLWSESPFYDGPKGTFFDRRDTLPYKWVRINNQIWMAENLKYDTTSSVYHIKDKDSTCGRLYDWATAMALDKDCNEKLCIDDIKPQYHQGMCPIGWHIPTENEWVILINNINSGNPAQLLKATSGWVKNNGDDYFDFTALPCGAYYVDESSMGFEYYGNQGIWWTRTFSESGNGKSARQYYMHSDNYKIVVQDSRKTIYYSVRCIKN